MTFPWDDVNWSSDDSQMNTAEARVIADMAASKNYRSALAKYQRESDANPKSALSNFKLATALLCCWESPDAQNTGVAQIKEMSERLELTFDKKSVRYCRMFWLMTVIGAGKYHGYQQLLELGLVLRERDPNYYLVNYLLSFELAYTAQPVAAQDMGYDIARELLRKYPKNPRSHYLMGHVLNQRMWRTKSARLGSEAKVHYRMYIHLLPPDAPKSRTLVGSKLIKDIDEDLLLLKRKKKLKP